MKKARWKLYTKSLHRKFISYGDFVRLVEKGIQEGKKIKEEEDLKIVKYVKNKVKKEFKYEEDLKRIGRNILEDVEQKIKQEK